MTTKTDNQPATKADVKNIVTEVVTEAIAGVATETLNFMSKVYVEQGKRFDAIDERLDRIETKLDSTIEWVADHETSIRTLKRQLA